MKGLKKLVGSRRFWVAVFGLIALVLNELGMDFSQEFINGVRDFVLLLIATYGAQDVVYAWKNGK